MTLPIAESLAARTGRTLLTGLGPLGTEEATALAAAAGRMDLRLADETPAEVATILRQAKTVVIDGAPPQPLEKKP
jgi:molybdopterin/thiamine biosynthesis adenylyltransferase